jgi:hypothetical protein
MQIGSSTSESPDKLIGFLFLRFCWFFLSAFIHADISFDDGEHTIDRLLALYHPRIDMSGSYLTGMTEVHGVPEAHALFVVKMPVRESVHAYSYGT